MTFIQRFGGAVDPNVHFHVLVTDGVYAPCEESPAPASFHGLRPPTDTEVASVLWEIAERTPHALARRSLLEGEVAPADPTFADERPLLSDIYAAWLASRIATGPRRGRSVIRLGTLAEPLGSRPGSALARSLRESSAADPDRERPDFRSARDASPALSALVELLMRVFDRTSNYT